MKRRNFLELLSLSGGVVVASPLLSSSKVDRVETIKEDNLVRIKADLAIIGGGLGGFAAAMAALRNNQTVVLVEETDWLGGQLTTQAVPPDEHQWIETHGATQLYRDFRNNIRDYYKKNYPLITAEKENKFLNPGSGAVSRLCHEPKAAVTVLNDMLAPYLSSGKLKILYQHKVSKASTAGTFVKSVSIKCLKEGFYSNIMADYFVDATELGDLLPLTGTAYVTGTESQQTHQELHAPSVANPVNNQSFTACFAIDYVPGEDHTIAKPKEYEFWRNHIPQLSPSWSGKLLDFHYSDPRTLKSKALGFNPEGKDTGDLFNLWNYRKIINKLNFSEGFYTGDITIVNWPQNDYMLGNIVDVSEDVFHKHYAGAKQLSLSLLYWLQTEAPRPDGKKGWPGIRHRKDIVDTADGLAKYPYVRESRRIKAMFTVTEQHVGKENRAQSAKEGENKTQAAFFYDSVGTGYYPIDLHPTCAGTNYVDFESLPFQIPLGALIPEQMDNILPANKNIGTTHITNGCFRLHPVEWSIGEAVGMLVDFCLKQKRLPRQVRADKKLMGQFQEYIKSQGLETDWPTSAIS